MPIQQEYSLASPPLVKGMPIVGSAVPLLRDTLATLRRAHEQCGDVFAIKAAHVEFVVMAGRDANRFLAEEGRDCFTSGGFWGQTLREMECPHSFIGVDGETHHYQRTLLMPHFAKSKFAPNIAIFAEIFRRTVAAHYHRRTAVAPVIRHVLSQQIGRTMQGYEPSSDDVEALVSFENMALNVCSLKKYPRAALRLPSYRAAKLRTRRLAERILAMTKGGGEPLSYLDVVLAKGAEQRPQWFTEGDIRAHAIMPFIAGTDTVGATLTFGLLELFKQPGVRHILQKEVDDVFRHGLPDCATLEGMVNLRNFTKELLRLYPTVYALRRTATRDFSFKGYAIRKGQHVLVFSTAEHTNPTFFKDPYRFDIDRYNEPRSERAPSGAIAPFGAGAHACMGAGLANILLPLNVALLLFYTNVEPASDFRKIKPSFVTPAMTVDAGFSMRVTPRRRRYQSQPSAAAAAPVAEALPAAANPPPGGAARAAGAAGAAEGAVPRRAAALRIVLERDSCHGHGVCVGEAPELFRIGEDGKVEALEDVVEGPLARKAQTAMSYCPTRTIRVVAADEA